MQINLYIEYGNKVFVLNCFKCAIWQFVVILYSFALAECHFECQTVITMHCNMCTN